MKRLPGILIALSLLAALLVGCGGGHDARVTAELDRADSLLRTSDTAAHSAALRQMLALDTARALQADEALRARHALLLTQAQFKCYAFPSNDSLINIARNYYAKHHTSAQDHELYTRSLIYSGAVAEELGHPQQAMQYYLEAESTADPNDHFNLGYINGRIAGIYESEYTTDSTDLVRYKKALSHFRKAGDIYWQAVCLTNIGGLYRTNNNVSALYYLQQAIGFSKKHGLTYNYYDALDKLCGLYYYMEDYKKSKDLATKVYQESHGVYDGTQYLSYGIRSFAELGMADSAEHYFKMLPLPQSQLDSMRWLKDLAEIYRSKGDFRNYSVYAFKSDSIADVLMLNSYQVQLKDAEEKYNNTVLQLKNIEKQRLIYILLLAFLLLALLFTWFWYHVKTRHRIERERLIAELEKSQTQLDATQQLLAEAQSHIDTTQGQLAEGQEQLQFNQQMLSDWQDNVGQKQMITQEIMDKIRYKNRKAGLKLLLKEYSDKLSISGIDEGLWQRLKDYVDKEYDNLTERWQSKYPLLTEEDFKFICLCCIEAPNVVIMLCMDYTNIRTVSNNKTRIPQEKMNTNENLDVLLQSERKTT